MDSSLDMSSESLPEENLSNHTAEEESFYLSTDQEERSQQQQEKEAWYNGNTFTCLICMYTAQDKAGCPNVSIITSDLIRISNLI